MKALCFVVGMLLLVSSAHALEWRDLFQRKDQQAHQLLQSGNAQGAAELFDDPKWRGVSQFQAENYEEALSAFAAGDDIDSVYNRGVAEVKAGQYDAAEQSFEEVLKRNPEHEDAAHNLDIAKALKQHQEQQQEQEQQSEDNQTNEENSEDQNNDSQNNDQNNSDSGDQSEEESQSAEQQQSEDSESQNTDQNESSDSQSSDSQSEGGAGAQQDNPQQGELSDESAQQAAEQAAQQTAQDQADDESEQALREQLQQQIDESDAPDRDNTNAEPATVPASQSLSEDQQATEQWLRRIPDDPSQLLRNKIKLNHMLEHSDVGDTEEPW